MPQSDKPCKGLALLIQYPELLSNYCMVCCCESLAHPPHFGCSYECRGIWRIVEKVLHFYALFVAHFCVQVQNIQMIRKELCKPPLQITNLARKRTQSHRLVRRRRTRQGAFTSFRFTQERLIWFFIFIRFRILRLCIDKHRQKCVSQPSENQRIHPSMRWPFIVPLSWDVILIFGVSRYQWETCQPPSMYPPCSWSTLSSVSFHKGL